MDKQVYRIDENGIYLEPVIINGVESDGVWAYDIPPDCIETKMPDGLFQPIKWTGTEWITTLTPEEIEIIKNTNPEPKPTIEELEQENQMLKERLTYAEDAILFLMDTR